ncbi:hypothetical protein V1264_023688 [Littorina saxatilis]|uniref:Uncharacterized protein n=1 Tax=Littorina saxatilis TaxID=31220 RepID=A0AAN9BC61_9CAEN
MGLGLLRGDQTVASTELYVDKVVKFISGLAQLLLGVVIVVLAHVLDLDCTGHRVFSLLVLCQAICLLLVLILWFWCFGQDLANHVQELIHHANHLTNQYRRYTEGVNRGAGHREVTETTLHSDLDNYLEYLLHVLTLKGERLYTRHLCKWVIVLVLCVLWLAVIIYYVVSCGLPKPVILQVLWVLPILILVGTVVLVTFHIAYDLCKTRDYENTFFYRAVPGTMDARLITIVSETYNPRYVWLLSRHCWHNTSLCSNAGLSKSLARKYCYVSLQHRHDRWRDQHFPTLRSDQVDRFQFNSEQWAQGGGRGDAGCCQAVLWCGLDNDHADSSSAQPRQGLAKTNKKGGARKKWNLSDRSSQVGAGGGGGGEFRSIHLDGDKSSGYYSSSGLKATHPPVAEDGYMTPNLFVRKLAKEAYTPEQMLDEEVALKKKKDEKRKAKPVRPSPRDDLHLSTTALQEFPPRRDQLAARGLGLSRDDTEVDYGAFYHPHDTDPHRMQREYDPLTYGVRMSVKKEMSKDVKVWRP